MTPEENVIKASIAEAIVKAITENRLVVVTVFGIDYEIDPDLIVKDIREEGAFAHALATARKKENQQ